MDPRTLKRQERIIKNRMAACLSRKKKKDQFSEMEARVRQTEAENGRLRAENQQLHRRLAQLQAEVEMLRGLQAPASPPPSPRRPLLLLSVLLLASLNMAPIGSMFSSPLASELGGPTAEASPGGRTLLWAPADEQADLSYLSEALNASNGYMCPKHVNQSEARRLSRVLHGWFDPSPPLPENGTVQAAGRPAPRRAGARPRAARRRPKRSFRKRHSPRPGELQLYDRWFGAYGPFMDAIERRADTFYVVSFDGDHLMLPALSHNQTQRPRMSLLLPSLPLNESMRAPEHFVAMMQIDCEVVNTKLLHIHESVVPTPPSNNSTPTGSDEAQLNNTRGSRRNFNFSAPPTGGFPVDTALRWNGSLSAGKRGKRDKHVRGKAPPAKAENSTTPPSNSTVDAWRRLRFGNDSVDGSGGGATFRTPQPVPDSTAERQRLEPQQRPRRPARLGGAGAPPTDDYFQSEH
ncbi:cyclic AMP-dependent transcription factor ATF-6 beta-like [Pollicipes pollicipes]|uniref:cyclic AMP-dependent transcription factor ATF-6 beta-like n=1 Tax=Pollicipes pollicipes TaxID=41117 RepID=UPI001884AA5A|nr:cyclic AMP-dependent transcription factor ATF-6 beta-like [Pollicipes pollicipes]